MNRGEPGMASGESEGAGAPGFKAREQVRLDLGTLPAPLRRTSYIPRRSEGSSFGYQNRTVFALSS